jgi:hypothetical protein
MQITIMFGPTVPKHLGFHTSKIQARGLAKERDSSPWVFNAFHEATIAFQNGATDEGDCGCQGRGSGFCEDGVRGKRGQFCLDV